MASITADQVRELGIRFYEIIDNHEDINNFIDVLDIENPGYKIILPGVELNDRTSTDSWYNRMVGGYFNGSHMIYSVDLESSTEETAVAKIVLIWSASVWNAPSPKSQSVNILTYTTWTVEKVLEGGVGGLKVLAYEIDRLDFAPGTSQQTPH